MAALIPSHGSRAQFFIGTPGTPGTANFEISQYLRTATLALARDKAEVTAFRSTNKAYVAGILDGTVPIDGPYDANIDGNLYGLLTLASPANTVAYQFGPTGIGAGLGILYNGVCMVDKYEVKSTIGSSNDWTGNIQLVNVVTRTVQ
jgi:hypothetical protein